MKVSIINMIREYGFTISTPSIQVHVDRDYSNYVSEETVWVEIPHTKRTNINVCFFIWALSIQFKKRIS